MYRRIFNPSAKHGELRRYLYQNQDMVGARVLSILIGEPDTPFDVLDLTLRLEFGNPNIKTLTALLGSAFNDIPAIDDTARRQYQRRIVQLTEQKARRLADFPASDTADIDGEIAWLTRELRASTAPNGKIKNLNPDKKKAYDRYQKAVQRLLDNAQRNNPYVYHLIKKNLVLGKAFVWKDL
jgi:hypothetical protein